MTFSTCPRCSKKGWYRPAGLVGPGDRRRRRCRVCGHDNRVELARDDLQHALDRGYIKVRRTLDGETKRGAKGDG